MDNLESLGVEEVKTVKESAVDVEKKARIDAMKKDFEQAVLNDTTLLDRKGIYSDALEVVNSLGWGDKGNIVLNPDETSEERLLPVSKNVGYRVINNGDDAIQYQTEVWAYDEQAGKFIGTPVTKVIAPGQTADLSRMYMTMFAARPEVSFRFANGIVVKGSGSKAAKTGLKGELETYHFRFEKDEAGEKKQINDDSVKLNVGEKIGGKWVVKQQFQEVFGFLNNDKEETKTAKAKKLTYTAQDLAAHYVRKLMKDAGI